MRRLAFILVLAIAGCATDRATRARSSPAPLEDFDQRVTRYVEVHKDLTSKLPAVRDKAEPERIVEHQARLQSALVEARRGAKQGDIFTPAVRPYFERLVKAELGGPANQPAREAVNESNPRGGEEASSKRVPLAVNAVYPKGAPLTTVPPSLLFKLPTLPEQLEFRFVGKALILRDTVANVVVDYLPGVVP